MDDAFIGADIDNGGNTALATHRQSNLIPMVPTRLADRFSMRLGRERIALPIDVHDY